jgi:hypothetical protein
MKHSLLLIMLLPFMASLVSAQDSTQTVTPVVTQTPPPKPPSKIRLNAYAAYVFDDRFDSYYDPSSYYEGTIEGGFQWGVGIEYMLHDHYALELMYLHQSTNAPTVYQAGTGTLVKNENFDVALDYIMLGGGRHMQKPGSRVEAYGGLYAGVAILNVDNPSNGNEGNATKFAWGIRLGGNVWTSGRMGIKLQAQLLSVAQGAGGGLYFGTGGVGAGVSTYSTIYQFSLGGGLTFKVGN